LIFEAEIKKERYGNMKDFRKSIEELFDKYESELTSCGIKIEVSKRYFETNVGERSYSSQTGIFYVIFDDIPRAKDRKREKEKGYNYRKNQYHCFVLTVIPLEKDLVKREFCKEYAFMLRKVERAHIGEEPRNITYEENKLLSKIEKRILKIIKKAKETGAKQACEDTFCDALRYSNSKKYGYKSSFCGKSHFYWEMVCMLLALAVFAAVIFIAWLMSKVL
jgi:hypothetical protein